MVEINNIADLTNQAHKLPIVVLQDIDNRITDWIAAGGKHDDNYIKQQCKYAERVINTMGGN